MALNFFDGGGLTPLHCAASAGSTACVRRLLSLSADAVDVKTLAPDEEEGDGLTPLYLAVASGREGCVGELLGAKASLRSKNGPKQHHVLHRAAAQGSASMVALLLNAGADVNAKDGDAARTPLYEAAGLVLGGGEGGVEAADKVGILTMLLDWGADARAKTREKSTVLHQVVRTGPAAAVELVLQAGAAASLYASDEDNVTPVTLAEAAVAAAEAAGDVAAAEVARGVGQVMRKWRQTSQGKWGEVCESGAVKLPAMDGAAPGLPRTAHSRPFILLKPFELNSRPTANSENRLN